MTIQSISEEVRRIQKKYGESDPFRLAQAMKIIVVLKPMGRYIKSFGRLKEKLVFV